MIKEEGRIGGSSGTSTGNAHSQSVLRNLCQAWLPSRLRSRCPESLRTGLSPVEKKQSLCFFTFLDGLSCFAADAFFKAAISLIPEVPKTINIDGKMRPSEPFLLEFLCNFFSTLLIVPVRPPRELKVVSGSDLLTWPSSALSIQGVLSVLVCKSAA